MLAHAYTEPTLVVVPLRPAVSAAVTWRILAELLRRHRPSLDLVVQDHSVTSTQETLALICRMEGREIPLAEFDVPGREFHAEATLGRPRLILNAARWPNRADYVSAYLGAPDPKSIIDQIEAILGLPDRHAMALAPSEQVTLTARLIATLLQRYSMSRMRLSIRCGMAGAPSAAQVVNPALQELHHLPQSPSAAVLHYVVTTTSPNGLATKHGVLSMTAQAWPWKHSAHAIDLYDAWRHHHSVDELTTAVQRFMELPEA